MFAERSEHVIVQPIGEEGVVGVVAQIVEGQDRDRFVELATGNARQHQEPHRDCDRSADGREHVDVLAPRAERRWAIFSRLGGRRFLDPARANIERPAKHERDWEAGEDGDDQHPQRPLRQLERRENGRAHLDQKPADDHVRGGDAIHLPPPQFAEETVETTVQ
jgi:hypothetical protein